VNARCNLHTDLLEPARSSAIMPRGSVRELVVRVSASLAHQRWRPAGHRCPAMAGQARRV